MGGRNLVATSENRIYVVNPFGEISEFGPGFMPEPQRMGEGITWQDRPVMDVDHWTGSETRRGNLLIRWRSGVTTTVANGVEARWTAEGGVLYTVMRAEPLPGQPWWSGGTDIYYLANERQGPMTAKTIVNWFKTTYLALGLVGCSSHSGRRTFVTNAARSIHKAGGSLRDVQELAGHRSIKTTQGYIEGNSDAQRRVIYAI